MFDRRKEQCLDVLVCREEDWEPACRERQAKEGGERRRLDNIPADVLLRRQRGAFLSVFFVAVG